MENPEKNKAEKGPVTKEETADERRARIRDGRTVEKGGPAKLGKTETKEG